MSFVCDICEHVFGLKSDLKRHQFKKNKCKKKSQKYSKENIIIDEFVKNIDNNNVNNITCKYCNKVFSKKSNVLRHSIHSCVNKSVYDMAKQEVRPQLLYDIVLGHNL